MTLGLLVVLVVDASHTGYSIAPLLYGWKKVCGDVKVMGVIYNKVGSERHKKLLREACAEVGLDCFGFIPRRKEAMNGERYLGLDFSRKADAGELADMMEESVDCMGIVE